MKKIKSIALGTILLIVAIILTILVLSNSISAQEPNGKEELGIDNISSNKLQSTYQLAWFVYNHSDEFLATSVTDIFKLNEITSDKGQGLHVRNENYNNYCFTDIHFPGTMCIFHSQSSKLDGYLVKISNIVDIETPGKMTVYKYNSEYGKTGYTKADVDLKEKFNDTTYSEDNDTTYGELYKQRLVAFALLANETKSEEYKNSELGTKAEEGLAYLWDGYGVNIKNLVNESGILDQTFWSAQGEVSTKGNEYAKEVITQRVEPNRLIDSVVTLEKNETNPGIEYKDDKAYIGPLQVTVSGGKPKITIGENEVKWTTKNNDGTYNEKEQEGINLTSKQVFYVVAKKDDIKNLTEVKVKVTLDYTKYKARILLATNKTDDGQNLMFVSGKEETGSESIDWTVQQIKEIPLEIQKKDASGNPLNVEGIIFRLIEKNNENSFKEYFKTDKNGNGIVVTDSTGETIKTDANGNPIKKVTIYANKEYMLQEWKNPGYGYKKSYLDKDDVTIFDENEEEITKTAEIFQDAPWNMTVQFKLNNDTKGPITIMAKNKQELEKLEIEKIAEDGTKLQNVEFVIQQVGLGHLELLENGSKVEAVTGEISLLDYTIQYVQTKGEATKFITDSNGKITISNLEVNKSRSEKYEYIAHEVYNPNYGYGHYGYGLEHSTLSTGQGSIKELKLNETNKIQLTNKQELGNLELTKYGKVQDNNTKVVLPDVGFAVQVAPRGNTKYAYLALYKNGKFVPNVTGTVTINAKNKASVEGTEYEVKYYDSNNEYSSLSDEEKAKITEFVTGKDGKLTVNNLEIYEPKTGEKYTYKLIETSNANYGYSIDVETEKIQLETGTTKPIELENIQIYTKISGYVWKEMSGSKSNSYDYLYTESSNDVKLKDLYITENGKLIKNAQAKIPVEIKLRDKITGNYVKTQPSEFDNETGKYTFTDIEIKNLSNYEIVFEYSGFEYTTTIPTLDQENGSRAKEVEADRAELNNKFGEVKNNNEVISTDGKVNTLEYNKQGHSSTVSKFNFDTAVEANTTNAGLNLESAFKESIGKSTTILLDNINMGIVLREQPKLAIGSDIHSVSVEVNGSNYNYYYNGRQNHYENLNGDQVGVKFENLPAGLQRYTRTVYSSDVEALNNGKTTMNVSIIYKIRLMNQSSELTSVVNQIANYFDGDYNIESIGSNIEGVEISNPLGINYGTPQENVTVKYGEGVSVETGKNYKSTQITLGTKGLTLNAGENKDIYIKFSVSQEAIKGLLSGKSTYHNATEIMSYSTHYGENTYKDDNNQYYATEQRKAGEIYAGIDKASQPGNIELELIKDPLEQSETPILNTANFEDDTTSAPSLILEQTEARKISGIVFEDATVQETKPGEERLGNGIFEVGEKPVQNVTVELYEINNEGKIGNRATYSNKEPATTKTDENGNYTFGYYDEESNKHVGILPGKYVIIYTYNNESYIIGNKNINLNDYKSTIIKSKVIENAFENPNENQRWYITQEDNRYSDARDDISLRPEYKENVGNKITNSTYKGEFVIEEMKAYTPIMDIGVEFTLTNEVQDANTAQLIKKLENVDFGIAERARVDIKIEKQITSLEILAQNGAAIIPKGDPSDSNSRMQYVKTGLPGQVSAEIESKLLQSAQLNLEYTITLFNNSEKDYLEASYYYYGRDKITENVVKVKTVVDYLDDTMIIDEVKNQEDWTYNVTAQELLEGGFIDKETVYKDLVSGNYHIMTTEAFKDIGAGENGKVKLYATRALAVSTEIKEENKVEIIELEGKRIIKSSIPGDYVPSRSTSEQDESQVELVITPPTGENVNYVLYIIAGVATSVILVLGIVIIKKKIIK